jgi:hypothetical protein
MVAQKRYSDNGRAPLWEDDPRWDQRTMGNERHGRPPKRRHPRYPPIDTRWT